MTLSLWANSLPRHCSLESLRKLNIIVWILGTSRDGKFEGQLMSSLQLVNQTASPAGILQKRHKVRWQSQVPWKLSPFFLSNHQFLLCEKFVIQTNLLEGPPLLTPLPPLSWLSWTTIDSAVFAALNLNKLKILFIWKTGTKPTKREKKLLNTFWF